MNLVNIRITKLNTGHIQASYFHPKTGKRVRKRFHTLKDANKFKHHKESIYAIEGSTHESNLFFIDVVTDYLNKFPNSSFQSRKTHCVSFLNYFSNYKLSVITTSDLQFWFDNLQTKFKLSSRTMYHLKSNFNLFFKYAESNNLIFKNPMTHVQFTRTNHKKRKRIILSVTEVTKMLSSARNFSPNVLYPYLAICAHTGARRNEVLSLKRDDVDFNTGLLHFRETKNGKDRFVRISPMLEQILILHLDNHSNEYLLINYDNSRLERGNITRLIEKFKAFFPIENKNWASHALRHSFAYNFLKKGGKMYQLQAILGHKSIDITVDLYGQLQAQDIECPSPYDI